MRLSTDDRQVIAARAATPYERHAAAGANPDSDDAGQLLRQWNQAFAPGDAAAFERRLGWDGFTLDSAARAVSPSVALQLATRDEWTRWLDAMCDEASPLRAEVQTRTFVSAVASGEDARPFPEVWALAVRAGRRALLARVSADALDRFAPDALARLEHQLAGEIGRYGDLALQTRFATFEMPEAGVASPPAPDARYRAFVLSMLDGGFVSFLCSYAVLARQLATIVESWVVSSAELIARLHDDFATVTATFADGGHPGRVSTIQPALSDPHHGRRRVSVLTFESGLRLVYKPRGVRIEHQFGDLLDWFNAGLDHPLSRLRVVDRETYGWVAFAAAEPVDDEAAAHAWFHRAGALMCLASVLGARDLHRENLVATRNGPVLVDLELLLQPSGSPEARAAESAPQGGDAGPPFSCLSTGMLSLVDLTPDGDPHDAGGLRGSRTGALPFPARVWRDCGADTQHVVEEPRFAAAGTHQVWLAGELQRPDMWSGSLLSGFAQAYRFLLDRRDELLAGSGPLAHFADCAIRVLPRPTNQYAMLAHVLATPKYQQDAAPATAAIDVLHRGYARWAERPVLWPVAVAERRAMLALDIPCFTVRCDGIDALDGRDVVAPAYFSVSGLDATRTRVRALSAADLDAQLVLLGRALAEPVDSIYESVSSGRNGRSDAAADAFVADAEWIAHQLERRAIRSVDGLVWPYRPLTRGPAWRDHHLYDGGLGPAVFFAALARVTGEPRWQRVAADALGPVRAHAARYPLDGLAADEPVGGGNGLGSVAYGLTLVGQLHDDVSWFGLARRVAREIPRRLAPGGPTDVVNGSAGAALALLALHEATADPDVLAAADACGRHLLAHESPSVRGAWPDAHGGFLLGFAHGASGVALAFARLYEATGDATFAGAARRAYRFVRRHHLQVPGNWPIAVGTDGVGAGGMMTGWCHGAPGVALAALGAARERPSEPLLRGIESTLRTVGGWQPSQADHLCCGTSGRIDVLLSAGQQFDRPDAIDAARALATRVVTRARSRGHFRLSGAGTDYRVFDPGFFQGLSGIGYQLLRTARPSEFPSVAGFDTRRSSLRYCCPEPGATLDRSARPRHAVETAGTEYTS